MNYQDDHNPNATVEHEPANQSRGTTGMVCVACTGPIESGADILLGAHGPVHAACGHIAIPVSQDTAGDYRPA